MPNRFHYQILRYIPDLNRMEPRNFGIILQDGQQTKFKINTRFAQNSFVDTDAFRRWRDFIEDEVGFKEAEQLEMFRPPKHTPEFLDHLQKLIKGNFNLSKPFVIEFRCEKEINEVLNELFHGLVSEREEEEAIAETRPTGRFRSASKEKKFERRGLRKYAHVRLDRDIEWIAYRIYGNGHNNLIQKVEFNREMGRTAYELNNLLSYLPRIPGRFLSEGNMIHVILDQPKPFSDQTEDESERYKKDRERIANMAIDKNISVYNTPDEVQKLIDQIDECLPQHLELARAG